jgi:hypothetical protein
MYNETKIMHSFEAHKTFKEFSDNVSIIKPCRFQRKEDFEPDHLEAIELIYVYGACLLDDGMVDGCHIERMKDGNFEVTVTTSGIITKNIEEAEKFLYYEWYMHECI